MRQMTIQTLYTRFNIVYDLEDEIFMIQPFLETLGNQYPILQKFIEEMKSDPEHFDEKIKSILKELFEMAKENPLKKKEILYQFRVIVSAGLISKNELFDFFNEYEGFKNFYYSI